MYRASWTRVKHVVIVFLTKSTMPSSLVGRLHRKNKMRRQKAPNQVKTDQRMAKSAFAQRTSGNQKKCVLPYSTGMSFHAIAFGNLSVKRGANLAQNLIHKVTAAPASPRKSCIGFTTRIGLTLMMFSRLKTQALTTSRSPPKSLKSGRSVREPNSNLVSVSLATGMNSDVTATVRCSVRSGVVKNRHLTLDPGARVALSMSWMLSYILPGPAS